MSRRYEVQDADSRKAVLTMRATSVDVIRAMIIRGDISTNMVPGGFVIIRDLDAGRSVSICEIECGGEL